MWSNHLILFLMQIGLPFLKEMILANLAIARVLFQWDKFFEWTKSINQSINQINGKCIQHITNASFECR